MVMVGKKVTLARSVRPISLAFRTLRKSESRWEIQIRRVFLSDGVDSEENCLSRFCCCARLLTQRTVLCCCFSLVF